MDKVQTNEFGSIIATSAMLHGLTPSDVNGLAPKLAALDNDIGKLHELAATQNQPTAGQTTNRDVLMGSMTDMALDVANNVGLYADENHDVVVAKAVDVRPPAFSRLRLLHRPWLAQQIHDAAAGVLPQLAPYNVTAETLTAFQTLIDDVKQGLDQPRTTVVAKSNATSEMAKQFAATEALLGQIDRLMFPLRKTKPDTYAAYLKARQVLDVPGTRSAGGPPPPGPAGGTPSTGAPAAPAPAPAPSAPPPTPAA